MKKTLVLVAALCVLMGPRASFADFFEDFDDKELPFNQVLPLTSYDSDWTTNWHDIRIIARTQAPGFLSRASSYPYYLQFSNCCSSSDPGIASRNVTPEVLSQARYAVSIDSGSHRVSEIQLRLYQGPDLTGSWIGWGRKTVEDPTPDDPGPVKGRGDLFYSYPNPQTIDVTIEEVPQPQPGGSSTHIWETIMTFNPTGFDIDLLDIFDGNTLDLTVPFDRVLTNEPYPAGFDPTQPVASIEVLSNGAAGNDNGIDDLSLIASSAIIGDLNGDGKVDVLDFGIFAGFFG